MAKLADVVYGTSDQLEELFNGQTVSGHTYNENDLYIEELGDDIELGASGSGMSVNNDNQLVVDLSASDIPSIPLSKISDVTATAAELNTLDGITATTTELNYTDGVTSNIQTQLDAKLEGSDVINNVTSTTTDKPLSANMGKELQESINNLKNIGRFLSLLDSSTGTVNSQPQGEVGDTYSYKVGDYYRISGAGNYAPKETATFTIDSTSGSSNFESGSISYGIGDVIYCSNITDTTSTWVKQASSGGGQVTGVKGDNESTYRVGSVNLTLDNFGVSATKDELNVLDGITASTTELNYTDGVTSNIQTQLDAKQPTIAIRRV